MLFEINQVKPGDADLNEVLNTLKIDILNNLNCHLIGEIVKFNPEFQTANIKIKFKKYLLDNTEKDYPVLLDCPIIIHNMERKPVLIGDECLVIFNDKDLDNWYISGTVVSPNTMRVHSINDAIAIIGIHNKTNSIANYNNDELGYNYLNKKLLIDLSTNKILIENENKNLKTLIQNLIDIIKNLQTIPASVGVPLTLQPTVITQLEQIKTEFGELLK